MKTIEYETKDKTLWGDGPWQGEPDKRQWRDEKTGYPCLIVRNPVGALCGYVGIPKGHKLYGETYENRGLDELNVHGGITFANGCNKKAEETTAVCHKVEDGEDDEVWWLGFDCAHAGDFMPEIRMYHQHLVNKDLGQFWPKDTYRDMAYVTKEVERLARQLKEMMK